MTSQKSSVNPRFCMFRSTLASNFLLPLLLTLALTVLMPVFNYVEMLDFNRRAFVNAAAGGAATLKEQYTYMLMEGFHELGTISILVIAACSVLLGVAVFRFIASKKTVNVYYSLGMTRKSLFVTKYLAGILMLVVAIAIPLAINLLLNFYYIGSSWQLWSATAYCFWSFSILACFAFTVTAAVFSCVGTMAEGCVFPFAILGAPMIVLYCLQYLMETLFGNPYGHYFTPEGAYQAYSMNLPTAYKAFNPLLFLQDGMLKLSTCDADGTYWTENKQALWSKPDFLPLILWTIAVVAVMFLGMYLFKKRKAEICGFLGANPVMNFLVTFLLGLLGFGLVIHFTASRIPMALAILIGLAAYAVIYAIVDMTLIRNWKDFLHGFVKLPVHLGIALVIGVVFATGLFGFSTRVPELSEIRSASITVPSDTFLGVGNVGGGGIIAPEYEWGSYGNMLDGITQQEDLAFVRQIHQQLAGSGDRQVTTDQEGVARGDQFVESPIQMVYELKNGRTLTRYYSRVPMAVWNQLLEIEDTRAGKEQICAFLTESEEEDDAQKGGGIALVSPYMEQATVVRLSASQRKTLLLCVANDLTAQKASRRYFPLEPLIGMVNVIEAIDSEGAVERSSFNPALGTSGTYTVYLTQDMRNTIQFLQANGFYELLGQPAEVESVEVIRAKENYNRYDDRRQGKIYNSYFLIGVWNSQPLFIQNQKDAEELNEEQLFEKAVMFQDAKRAQEIASHSHISYFYGVDGYFVRAKLAGGKGYTTMFLPESAAPQYVKDAVNQAH